MSYEKPRFSMDKVTSFKVADVNPADACAVIAAGITAIAIIIVAD